MANLKDMLETFATQLGIDPESDGSFDQTKIMTALLAQQTNTQAQLLSITERNTRTQEADKAEKAPGFDDEAEADPSSVSLPLELIKRCKKWQYIPLTQLTNAALLSRRDAPPGIHIDAETGSIDNSVALPDAKGEDRLGEMDMLEALRNWIRLVAKVHGEKRGGAWAEYCGMIMTDSRFRTDFAAMRAYDIFIRRLATDQRTFNPGNWQQKVFDVAAAKVAAANRDTVDSRLRLLENREARPPSQRQQPSPRPRDAPYPPPFLSGASGSNSSGVPSTDAPSFTPEQPSHPYGNRLFRYF